MAWLIAGLGNPGDRYATTRHNLGAMVAEELAREARAKFRKARFVPVDIAEIHESGERLVLARSHRYMNEAGPSYASIAKKHHIDPDHVIAVHDELDLPPGAIRLKFGGGNNGHNGLRSLQQGFGTPDFFRVRIGVGRPTGRQDPAEFVLEPIPKRLEADVAIWADRGALAVRALIEEGIDAAQNRIHGAD
ncbi:MAG: aminoacyl-tRNA hydrolase [Actinomycetota bacterium]